MNKYFTKIMKSRCFAICTVVAILLNISTINTPTYNAATEIHPFQKFIIEAMSLGAAGRNAIVDELDPDYVDINSADDVTDELVQKIAGYVTNISTIEVKEALITYAERKDSKVAILTLILQGLIETEGNKDNCRGIIKIINSVATGNENDDKGIDFIMTLLKNAATQIDTFIFNGIPESKIKVEITNNSQNAKDMISKISYALDHFESLSNLIKGYSGKNSFEKFLNYIEITVNNQSDNEIVAFKQLLIENGEIYKDELAPSLANPTPTPTPTSTPTPSPTPTLVPTGAATPSPTPTGANTPTPTPVGQGGTGGTGGGTGGIVIPGATTAPSPQPTPAKSSTFTDISHVSWAVESINELAAKGIISGMGDGKFKPDDKITREQFIKMIVFAFNLMGDNTSVDFNDVDKNAWYYPSVASAKQNGITQGMGDGTFGVGRNITRQEMSAIAFRASTKSGIVLPNNAESQSFTDFKDIDTYAIEPIKAMQSAGIINGVGDNRFAPLDNATRAQAAKIIYMLISLKN